MNYARLFFSLRGRIGRLWYWVGVVAIWAATNVIGVGIEHLVRTESTSFTYLQNGVEVTEAVALPIASDPVNIVVWCLAAMLGLTTLYVYLAIHTKRWHDRDKSGWWTLIILVPVIGWVWTIVECGMLRGTEGTNRYGTDPLVDPLEALDRRLGYEL